MKKKNFFQKLKHMEPLDLFVNILVLLYAIVNLDSRHFDGHLTAF